MDADTVKGILVVYSKPGGGADPIIMSFELFSLSIHRSVLVLFSKLPSSPSTGPRRVLDISCMVENVWNKARSWNGAVHVPLTTSRTSFRMDNLGPSRGKASDPSVGPQSGFFEELVDLWRV